MYAIGSSNLPFLSYLVNFHKMQGTLLQGVWSGKTIDFKSRCSFSFIVCHFKCHGWRALFTCHLKNCAVDSPVEY